MFSVGFEPTTLRCRDIRSPTELRELLVFVLLPSKRNKKGSCKLWGSNPRIRKYWILRPTPWTTRPNLLKFLYFEFYTFYLFFSFFILLFLFFFFMYYSFSPPPLCFIYFSFYMVFMFYIFFIVLLFLSLSRSTRTLHLCEPVVRNTLLTGQGRMFLWRMGMGVSAR